LSTFYENFTNKKVTTALGTVPYWLKGALEFKVFGGSMRPLSSKEIVDEQDGVYGLSTYNLGFYQAVVLKKVKK
jgi:hypothetical protein